MTDALQGKLIAVPQRAPGIRGQAVARWLASTIIRNSSWRLVGEFPSLPKLVAIAAPHSSNWDGIIGISFAYALGVRATWMGKNSLFKFGLDRLMRGLGGIPTDRSNPRGAVGQMAEMVRTTNEPLWLFLAPEGTRKKVPKWRTGFWHIASEAGVPILLVAIDYPRRTFVVGPLFYPTGDKERDLQALYDYYRPFQGKHGKSGLPLSAQ
jgi:1-acyl-sn-glycerol-3-phosphate acyltransferase